MGNDKGWQNTVRHNLSHMKCFRRIMVKEALLMGPLTTTSTTATKDEPMDPPTGVAKPRGKSKAIKKGKGGYWVLVPEHLEETSTQIRPKKSSVDHTGSSSSSTSLSRGSRTSLPLITGSPKRKSQDLGIPAHQQRPSPMMDHRGSLTSASSLWAQPRFSEPHRLSQSPQLPPQPPQSFQHPQHRDQDIDVGRDVASMVIASMAIADNPPYHSQSYPPGQYAIMPSQPYVSRHPRFSRHQQQQQAISPEPSRAQEESEKRPEMATRHSSRLSESSRGSEEDELEEDDDDDEYEDDEDDNDEDDEDEDGDDRSTSSKDSRLGAGMSIHHLLN
ncbi:hypothetical protein BGZ93_004058 [Podila epicladia]|nr:hypothetical protein BGZ93_004058 [Podila epicladia]